MTCNRANIDTILQILKNLRPVIDHGNIVSFARQILGYGSAYLAGAKNNDFHGLISRRLS